MDTKTYLQLIIRRELDRLHRDCKYVNTDEKEYFLIELAEKHELDRDFINEMKIDCNKPF